MDRRAVVALVIVLGDRLPVRLDGVLMRGADEQTIGLPPPHEGVEASDVLPERRRRTVRVDEDPSLPFMDPSRDERVVGLREPFQVAETRGGAERPVELVDPCVVGALDRGEVPRRAWVEELMTTVAARVVEASKVPLLVSHDEDSFGADPERLLVAGLREIVRPPDAHPSRLEEVLDLPVEHRSGGVRLGRQGPGGPQRRCQDRLQQVRRDRARRHGGVSSLFTRLGAAGPQLISVDRTRLELGAWRRRPARLNGHSTRGDQPSTPVDADGTRRSTKGHRSSPITSAGLRPCRRHRSPDRGH